MRITDMITHKMNLLEIKTSPNYFCRKLIGATNENLNFDLTIQRVKIGSPLQALL